MTIIVNPGSDPVTKGDAWTNTFDAALGYATEWHERMRAEGLADIEMLEPDRVENDGRWTFRFRHTVTGVVVELRHHGVAPLEAYRAAHIFGDPRVYWCGSSSANPELAHWAADGFVQTYRASEADRS